MNKYEVGIIGGGPGGYVAASRLQQYGIETALFEKERLGGVCLNWGCIPTKALVKATHSLAECKEASKFGIECAEIKFDYQKAWQWKNEVVEKLVGGIEFIIKKRNIAFFNEEIKKIEKEGEEYKLISENGEYHCENVIIATGSKPKSLPGFTFDGEKILSSQDMLNLKKLPSSLAVIGGGVIGSEFASIFQHAGVNVHIIELLPSLVATEDKEVSRRLAMAFKKRGIKLHMKTKVETYEIDGNIVKLKLSSGKEIEVEKVLMSVGREANPLPKGLTEKLNTDKGFVRIDDDCQTNLSNIYAIGDITGKMLLAHTASKQGLLVANLIRAKKQKETKPEDKLIYHDIPRCTFTDPEIGSVGLTEEEATEKYKDDVKVGKFPFSANGKALGIGDTFGFVKVIARRSDKKIIGMHIIGPQATELIAQGGIIIGTQASYEQINKVVFAHPTLSESVMEACEDLENLAIHKL